MIELNSVHIFFLDYECSDGAGIHMDQIGTLQNILEGYKLIYPDKMDYKGDIRDDHIIAILSDHNIPLYILIDLFFTKGTIRTRTLFRVFNKWADTDVHEVITLCNLYNIEAKVTKMNTMVFKLLK